MKKEIKNKNVKKGFTLVELLVAITVLSILGTIGMMYFDGYSSDARNSKRTSDLVNIRSKIELTNIKGISIKAFVLDNTSTLNNNISIGGLETYANLSGSYFAGNINYSTLGLDPVIYSDPSTLESYKIGLSTIGKRYEIAATLENDDLYDSIISGSWIARNTTNLYPRDPILKQDRQKGIFYLSGMLVNDTWLTPGDYVSFSSTGSYKILMMDRNKIYVEPPILIGETGSNIRLLKYETVHLIKRYNNDWPINVGGDGDDVPYKLK